MAAILAAAAAAAAFPTPSPAPVNYVKICPLRGPGFCYYPGTDVCVSPSTHEAREDSAGGVWSWRVPNNPPTWVASPAQACSGGHLVKFGDIAGADLSLNAYDRFETTTRLGFPAGHYISSVMYQGGLTGLGQYLASDLPACPSANAVVTDANDPDCTSGDAPQNGGTSVCDVACRGDGWEFQPRSVGGIARNGSFCMFYHYDDPGLSDYVYAPLGCIDTVPQASLPQALALVPDEPEPPIPWSQVDIRGASGDIASTLSNSDIHGTLSMWLCLRATPCG